MISSWICIYIYTYIYIFVFSGYIKHISNFISYLRVLDNGVYPSGYGNFDCEKDDLTTSCRKKDAICFGQTTDEEIEDGTLLN